MAAALLWIALPAASAHRLDEFLQATTIGVERDRVTAQIRLTPGVAVAPAILAGIDTDGDGTISEAEQRAYAERVLRDLSLTVDGNRLPLRRVSSAFPTVGEMLAGTGDILFTFRADVPRGGPSRRLTFENHHQSGRAAYLVNCLFPEDPEIRVIAQSRNYEQTFYQVDYTQAAGVQPGPASSAAKPTVRKAGGPSGHPSWFQAVLCQGAFPGPTGTKRRLFFGVLVLTAGGYGLLRFATRKTSSK